MEGFALANLREGYHLHALVRAVDSGKIPANANCPYDLPTIATALKGWPRLEKPEDDGGVLARFHPGQVWDGGGIFYPQEILVAALFRAGAELFPNGPEEAKFENLEVAIYEDAQATAVSLLHAPQCPDLASSSRASFLLSKALEGGQSKVVRAMLDKGADPNRWVKYLSDRERPAWFSARNPAHLKWLLEAGADPSIATEDGRTAQQVWAENKSILSKNLKDMGVVLSEWLASHPGSGVSEAQSPAVMSAFAAGATLRIGALRDAIAKAPEVLSSKLPVPGLESGEEETLAQQVVRAYLFDKEFSRSYRNTGRCSPAALGILKVFLDRKDLEEGDRGLVALVALAMGVSLGDTGSEMVARRMWTSLRVDVEEILEEESARNAAWRNLGHVFRRASLGASVEGGRSGVKSRWVAEEPIDSPRRVRIIYGKIGEILTAGRLRFPSNMKAELPVQASRMLAAWSPGFTGAKREAGRAGFQVVECLMSAMKNPPSPDPGLLKMSAARSIAEQDAAAHAELMRRMQTDPEVFLGTMVSLVVYDRDQDFDRLAKAIQEWEKALPMFNDPSLWERALGIFKKAQEKDPLHPELARIKAELRGKLMDLEVPEVSSSATPLFKSRF